MSERKAALLAIAFGAFLTLTSASFAAMPRAEMPVAVLASPFEIAETTALEIVAEADGQLVSMGLGSWIAVASNQHPDLVSRLYDAGAFIVVDAAFVEACIRFLK